MFGKIIYYDRDRISEFISLIKGETGIEVNELVHLDEKKGSIDLKVIGADAKASTSYTVSIKESLLLESAKFEEMLVGRDDYLDFFTNEYSVETVGRGIMIKIWGSFFVPEEFDLTHTLKKFKPFLVSSMKSDSDFNDDSIVAMNALINSDDDTKIPVVVEFEELKMCSMLNSKYLSCSFEELEDYEDEEVTILARMASNGKITQTKAYYDPLKDFMSLNRALRRTMNKDRGEGLEPLYLEEDYYKLEIVVIYQ